MGRERERGFPYLISLAWRALCVLSLRLFFGFFFRNRFVLLKVVEIGQQSDEALLLLLCFCNEMSFGELQHKHI